MMLFLKTVMITPLQVLAEVYGALSLTSCLTLLKTPQFMETPPRKYRSTEVIILALQRNYGHVLHFWQEIQVSSLQKKQNY